jgi:inner membrane protein
MNVLLGLSYLAVGTHPSLDWLNNYGMRWLMPFEGRWFYGDSLYIVDPWVWIVLGGSLFLLHSRRWWSVVSWSLFAASAGALLVLFVPGLVWAKLLWLALLVAVIVARYRGIGLEEEQSRRIAIGALCLTSLYIAGMVTSVSYARNAVADALRQEGMEVVRLMVSPVRVTPFERDVVIQTPRNYRYGRAKIFPRFEIELDPRSIPLLPNTGVVRAATKSPNARGFMNWARFPYAEVDEHEGEYEVYLLDARYMRSRDRGFGVARVIVPKDTLGD